ncbi:aldo/keto reductase [Pseudobacter ginsenosidimutans]|uniref:D-threo-aldose 1-dehydrogenase n=1 Tax=Pseudobacter ginsenosidimutans TaxID=661488 RepID=A0A4Q7MDE6_9BACT|nr:aldo/keto reductase [Pseudobacter ginsenosidimutans]QEC45181.1 aldo/keto reductase [Pseudobacter ginsenosidimutans]RZS65447.1 D-threo-aldose 1-dehydrogenase [Pseudobacter ginsenosidimutans]
MLQLPPVIAGTSSLGNLYVVLPPEKKKMIVAAYLEAVDRPAVFDCAGKYGAGLALETLGQCLKELGVPPEDVMISNKLGWIRTPLLSAEPGFERDVWKDLRHDARQQIGYDEIMECYEQGNELLGDYNARMVSIHDPDEYLFAARSEQDANARYRNILDGYRALADLKEKGMVDSIGIGSKDWKTIQRISRDITLDWVMFANSITIYSHPQELLNFVNELSDKGIAVINSAVFHGGFLTGSDYFNYQRVSRNNEAYQELFLWRDRFHVICKEFGISPATAAIRFALEIPGVCSIALSSSSPVRTSENLLMADAVIPGEFWEEMKARGLLPARDSSQA